MKGDYQPATGDVLRAVMDFHGIDAAELARRTGRNEVVVRRWMRGDAMPRLEAILEIANTLDAPVDVFVRPPATRDGVFARMLAHRAIAAVERAEP